MIQVRIEAISGCTYPMSVYVSNIFGNYETLIGTINPGPVPPSESFSSTIPEIFDTAPEIMVKVVSSEGCETTKILECTYGCAFEIIVEEV
jgi:hypothetical protein